MAAVDLTPDDLVPFAEIPEAKALAMIDDALALAARVAPCITEPDFPHPDAARAILRSAVLRWNDAGSGALQSEGIGSYQYTMDTRQTRRGMFWPSEIEQLQELCRSSTPGAFTVDTAPSLGSAHRPWCDLYFLGSSCSCGVALTGGTPLVWP